jgi:HAMP domain-containing protein
VLVVLLVAVGAFLLVRLHSSLVAEIDRSLDVRAVQIAAGFQGGGEGEFRDLSDTTLQGLPRGESAAQLVGRAGVLESSGDAVAATPMVPAPLLGEALGGTTVRATVPLGADHEPFRALALPVPGHEGEAIVVVTSLDQAARSVHDVRVLLAIAVPVALLVAAVAGLLLARKALRPVEAMTSKARSISADDLGERIDVPRTADEISRLGFTLNGMLDRLERDVVERRRFVADASHELRTPLAAMRTTLEVALDSPEPDGDARLALEDTLSEVVRMSRTVDALLTPRRGRARSHSRASEPPRPRRRGRGGAPGRVRRPRRGPAHHGSGAGGRERRRGPAGVGRHQPGRERGAVHPSGGHGRSRDRPGRRDGPAHGR